MTDRELSDALRKAQTPKRSEDYWQDFPGVVSRRIGRHESNVSVQPRHPKRAFALGWAVGLAMICVLAGFWFGTRHSKQSTLSGDLAQARKLVAELTSLFPNQIQAIVIENGRTELRLSDKPDLPQSTPVLIRICGKDGCEKVITFSGQQVLVNGQPCDVLVDAHGNVIVAGPRFVWSTAGGAGNSDNARIDAKSLGDAL